MTSPEPSVVPSFWDGNVIDFGTDYPYICDHGMKFVKNFDLSSKIAKCTEGNIWAPPADWDSCVESMLYPNIN
jgi:hypothetical protein